MANSWLTLVKKTFVEGRKKNKEYSYKQAMIDARIKKNHSKGGSVEEDGEESSSPPELTDTSSGETSSNEMPTGTTVGGKSRRNKKSKGSKKSKKTRKTRKTRKSRKTRK
jgi:hypothetical protein